MLGIASAVSLVAMHGTILFVIGLAILLGAYLRISAVLASLMMLAIIGSVIASIGLNDLVIRDTVVLLVSVSLAFDDTRYMALTK
jgi:uncharacterized membrane protein YphA (DoxX/SURF4 family)